MAYIFEVLEIPFVGQVAFHFIEVRSAVPPPGSSYIQGKIILPEYDEVHYLSLPTLDAAREYLSQLNQ